MKIIGIAATLPSRIVSNEEVLDLIQHHSKDSFDGDLPKTLKIINKVFKKSGMESRHWLAPGERPMEMLQEAFERALSDANIKKEDIDLLIYTGVGRGFIEPANSCFIANALGLKCRNFDVLEACMGWVASMDIVNDKMKAGAARNAVVVNMEFNMIEGSHIYPKNFSLKSATELPYKFPSYMVGDALTVTILSNEDPNNFKFTFVSRPDLCNLCTIPLPCWESFCNLEKPFSLTNQIYNFNSYGYELHEEGRKEIINVLNKHEMKSMDIKYIYTHTSSPTRWEQYGQVVNITDKFYLVAHKTGN
ncbi:3-oxoacyl-ACP synthase, partial [Herbaspirillum sp. RTI4]